MAIAGEYILRDTDVFVTPNLFVSAQMRKRKAQIAALAPVIETLFETVKGMGMKKKPVIRFCSIADGTEGYAYDGGLDVEVNVRALESDFDILECVAHELVHCAQYQSKRLIPVGDGNIWEGRYVEQKKDSYRAYRLLPHEVEAHRLQRPLARAAMRAERVSKELVTY